MDYDVLKELGLTEYECRIYLALLEHGELSGYVLAEKTGLYRQATYDALNRLIEKGYVSSTKEGSVQIFKAISPELILSYLEEKTDRFKELLPKLIIGQSKKSSALAVEIYRGKNVTRIAFRDIIAVLKNSGGEVLCTAVDESIPIENYKTLCDQYERDMLRYKIKERVIVPQGAKGIFLKGTTKYKFIDPKFFNPNPIQVYGNNVQLILWGNPDHLIIIRSIAAAEAYRKQFELVWRLAK